jgi:hypothetical protein
VTSPGKSFHAKELAGFLCVPKDPMVSANSKMAEAILKK